MKLLRIFQPSIIHELSLATYCLLVYAITTMPTFVVVGIVLAVTGSSGTDPAIWQAESTRKFDSMDLFGTVVAAPILETFLLGFLIGLAGKVIVNRWRIALLVALVFALLHGSIRATWSLVVFWPFVALAMSFIVWRSQSYWRAYVAAFVPHMLNNLTASLLMISDRS